MCFGWRRLSTKSAGDGEKRRRLTGLQPCRTRCPKTVLSPQKFSLPPKLWLPTSLPLGGWVMLPQRQTRRQPQFWGTGKTFCSFWGQLSRAGLHCRNCRKNWPTKILLSLLHYCFHPQHKATGLKTNRSDASSTNLCQKLAPMHTTKIVRFDWSAVFESFRCQKLGQNRAAFCSVKVSSITFLSVFHHYNTWQAWVNYIFNQLQLNYNYMTFDQLQLQSGKLQLQLLFTHRMLALTK